MQEKNIIYKNKRRNIKNQHYSTGGMVGVTLLGCLGVLFFTMSGILDIENYDMLYDCFSQNGILIIFGCFFIFVSIYCWISFFKNIIMKPKKEVLLLLRKEEDKSIFINKKGRTFTVYDCNKNENKYYYVLKTYDYVYEVLEECNEFINDWPLKEKKSYWLNLYSPMGNFENLFLLPIVYVILLPGVLSIFMSHGFQKIYGIIFSIVPLYIIIYDFIYKIKLKKSLNNVIDDSGLVKSYIILRNMISTIIYLFICFILVIILSTFSQLPDLTSKIIFLPFLLCGLCIVGLILAKIFSNSKLEKIFLKSYYILFLFYLVVCLILFIMQIIKEGNSYVILLFTIPLLIVGVYVFYKLFIRKK